MKFCKIDYTKGKGFFFICSYVWAKAAFFLFLICSYWCSALNKPYSLALALLDNFV